MKGLTKTEKGQDLHENTPYPKVEWRNLKSWKKTQGVATLAVNVISHFVDRRLQVDQRQAGHLWSV